MVSNNNNNINYEFNEDYVKIEMRIDSFFIKYKSDTVIDLGDSLSSTVSQHILPSQENIRRNYQFILTSLSISDKGLLDVVQKIFGHLVVD